jgi:HlyD family secretion protein
MNNNAQGRRRIVLTLITFLVAWGLYQGFRPQPLEVDIGNASRGPLRVTVEQEGRTRVIDRYVVAAPVNGYARRIRFDVGDTVEQGTTLVELEPLRAEVIDARRHVETEARIAATESSVSAAQQRENAAASNAKLPEKELRRLRSLRPRGFVIAAAEDRAVSEAERNAAELRSARFAVATASHELEAARTPLKYAASGTTTDLVDIRAPVTGRALKIPRKSEGTVMAGQSLIEIGDPRTLEVEVDVLSTDAVSLHIGTRVIIKSWGGVEPLEGVVRKIDPSGFTKVSALGVEEQRVWVIIAFTSPRELWQRLGDGYRVEAGFILWDAGDVLQIPASALFRHGNGWAAYTVEQGKAVIRNVNIGQRNGLNAQVVNGINASEKVILHPDDRVREGVRVVLK